MKLSMDSYIISEYCISVNISDISNKKKMLLSLYIDIREVIVLSIRLHKPNITG